MPRVCKICQHSDRAAIEAQMARCLPKLEIARNFTGLSHNNVENHLKHFRLPIELEAHRRISFDASFRQHFTRLEKLLAACDKWLIDPDDESRYTVAPRASDLKVIYEKEINGVLITRTARLSDLLDQINGQGRNVLQVSYSNDKYKLFLDTIAQLHHKLEMLAKISGKYKQDAPNPEQSATFAQILAPIFLYGESELLTPKVQTALIESLATARGFDTNEFTRLVAETKERIENAEAEKRQSVAEGAEKEVLN